MKQSVTYIKNHLVKECNDASYRIHPAKGICDINIAYEECCRVTNIRRVLSRFNLRINISFFSSTGNTSNIVTENYGCP